MDKINPEKIKQLYLIDKMSVPMIARQLHYSQWMIYKIMRKNGIERRSRAESFRLRFESTPLSYMPNEILTDQDKALKLAALMLYWAENSKRNHHTIDFANSDPEMVLIFLECLRRIYGVSEARLRVLLYCYANQPLDDLLTFWSNLTSIPLGQFTKPFVRKDYTLKHHEMVHGLVHIRYSDQRLFRLILEDIRKTIVTLPGYSSGQRGLTVTNRSLSSKDELKSGRIAGSLIRKRW